MEEVPGSGGDGKTGRDRVVAPPDAARDGVERMSNDARVDQRVDRPAKPDEFGAAGKARCPRQAPREGARVIVIEQNAPFSVAHDDALGEFGHQRGELVALLRDAGCAVPDLFGHRAAERSTLSGKPVDRLGKLPERCGALRDDIRRGACADHRARGVGHPQGRDDPHPVKPVGEPCAGTRPDRPPQQQKRAMALQERKKARGKGGAVLRGQGRADPCEAKGEPQGERTTRKKKGRDAAGRHASMSCTVASSARVEKGFVT